MEISDNQLKVLRALADTRSPVPYIGGPRYYGWDTMLALHSEGLVTIHGTREQGGRCTLSRAATAEMVQLANDCAQAWNRYSLAETPRSRSILAMFRTATEAWAATS